MSKIQTILLIIQTALAALANIPVVGPEAQLAAAFLKIYQNAAALYQSETGKPFDPLNIPLETKVP
jgi:hypothetical protein